MRITGVSLEGFGCLKNVDFRLASGLNLFFGPNEAGKSTLQQGILALLYGFFEGDRRRSAETKLWESFVPWRGGPYRGQLEYELVSDRRYRVERDFGTADIDTTIWDADVGGDITRQFGVGRHGNVPFARRHLGMTRSVFQSCAFLSQGELFGILGDGEASPQEIGDTIVALADTGRRDMSAEAAANRLDQVLKGAVGGPRARAAPLPAARQRVALLEAELRSIEALREEISSQAVELDAESTRTTSLEEQVGRTRYLLRDAQLRQIDSRLKQLDELSAQMLSLSQGRERLGQFATFPNDERDHVLAQWNTIGELVERVGAEEQDISEAQDALTELTKERERLARERAALSHLADFPVDREAQINGLLEAYKAAQTRKAVAEQRYEQARRDAEPVLAEYAVLVKEVGALTARELDDLTASLATRPPSLPIRAVLVVGRALWAFLCLVGRSLLHAVQWVFAKLRGRPVPQAGTEGEGEPKGSPAVQEATGIRAGSLTPEVARTMLERHRRFLALAPRYQAFHGEEEALAQAGAGLEVAAQAVRNALQPLVGDVSDVDDGIAAFQAKVEGSRRLTVIDAELTQMDARRALYSQRIDEHEEAKRRCDGMRMRLQSRLTSFALAGNDLDALVKAFEEGCQKREQYEDLGQKLAAAEEHEAVLLGGKSRGELAEAERILRQELDALLHRSPSLEGARTAETPEVLQRRLSQESEELREAAMRTEHLRAATQTRMTGLRQRAEVEEELERYRREVAALEEFGKALGIAAEVIRDAMIAAHRDFAPSVGRFLGEGLSLVTAGRYQDALLDPSTLGITVQIPETGALADSEVLSRGTRAAVYVLLRVGLAQHMSSIAEPIPLIMDDPLVDLDDVRLDNFLDLIYSLTEQVQVLLFTKDRDIADWFSRRCGTNDRHQLYPMPVPFPAANAD